jgi:putative addiction module killer protein
MAAARITTAIRRLELGHVSNVKGVRAGVFEYRIDAGPGYRIYFGRDGAALVLLSGGTKQRQDRDIAAARERWSDYKTRKARCRAGRPTDGRRTFCDPVHRAP